MFHINDSIKNPWKLSVKWFNLVASWLNNVCGDGIIEIRRPDSPKPTSPILFRINMNSLRDKLGLARREVVHPFTLYQELNSANTAVAHLWIYLPSLTFNYSGVDYTIQTGSGTGQVVADPNDAGWYEIKGIQTGSIYLVDATASGSTTKVAKFATAPLSDASKLSYAVGSSSLNVIQQFAAPMTDKMKANGETVGEEYGQHEKVADADSSFPSDSATGAYAKLAATSKWKLGDTKTESGVTKRVGVSFRVISRIKADTDEGIHYAYYRTLKFSNAGILLEVGAEEGAVQILA